MKNKMKLKLGGLISFILIIIFSLLLIYSGIKIIKWKVDNHKNKTVNELTHEYIQIGGSEKYNIDFAKLKKINPDIVAYLKVNNTNIDYVVVKGEDNNFYLNHNLKKEKNDSGWIFADYKNKLDDSDKNIVIYGHNTVDKSMFGSLKFVLDEKWAKDEYNHIIYLVTEDKTYKYEVFSTYKIDNEGYYIKTSFSSDDEYKKFINTIKKRSYYNYNVELSENDQILTLSTCSNSGKKRVVLHAKKIEEENNINKENQNE